MARLTDMARLQTLAGLVFDHRLTVLQTAARAKAQTEAALAGLAAAPEAEGLEGAAGALAGLAYQRWADARRAEMNLVLARQTRDWMDAQSDAREAFGRAEVLRKLSQQQR